MTEELGSEVAYLIGKPIVFMRHQREEAVEGSPIIRIFAIGYQSQYQGGEIQLSPRHTEMQWVDIKTFKPEEYFIGGWLKGVQEYLKLKTS